MKTCKASAAIENAEFKSDSGSYKVKEIKAPESIIGWFAG